MERFEGAKNMPDLGNFRALARIRGLEWARGRLGAGRDRERGPIPGWKPFNLQSGKAEILQFAREDVKKRLSPIFYGRGFSGGR